MKHKLIPIIIILILLALGAGGYVYFSRYPALWQQTLADFGLAPDPAAETRLTASGFIEVNEINLSSEVGGRIKTLAVDEGDPVSSGQKLVYLKTALLDARTEQVVAQIAFVEAQLARLKAGLPPAQIAVAKAAVDLAKAQREGAHQGWQDAILVRDTPQELLAQIDGAYDQSAIAERQIEQALLMRDAVELRESIAADFWKLTQEGRDFSVTIPVLMEGQTQFIRHNGHFDFPEGDKQQAAVEWNLATMDVWQAWLNWENAQATYDSTQSQLNTLRALKADPLLADLQVVQAEANYHTQAAAVTVAQAELAQLKAGTPEAQIAILEAQLEQARSQLTTLAAQREKYTLTSPIDGVVVARAAYQGEIATPGATLLTISDLEQVSLTVFVSAADYGRLRQNQNVEVYVDSYPGRAFPGAITYISDEAEFTPKNVQTREERVNLVYAIKITLPSEAGKLKPGMPADVVFVETLAAAGGE